MDIRCVQLVAYEIAGKNYLDIEQVIPLPPDSRLPDPDREEGPATEESPGRWRRLDPLPDHHRR
jgi:hypothetical protein